MTSLFSAHPAPTSQRAALLALDLLARECGEYLSINCLSMSIYIYLYCVIYVLRLLALDLLARECGDYVYQLLSISIYSFVLYISHIIPLKPQQQSAEPRNSASAEKLAVMSYILRASSRCTPRRPRSARAGGGGVTRSY